MKMNNTHFAQQKKKNTQLPTLRSRQCAVQQTMTDFESQWTLSPSSVMS